MNPTGSTQRTLTARQREILNFIKASIERRGYAPTVREIAAQFSIRSPNGVRGHLRALEAKGFIVRDAHRSRAIRVAEFAQLGPQTGETFLTIGFAFGGADCRRASP
ncbi:MAG: hypothetical protein KatS3mg112_1784 [Thermogutta sp.]|nr:MAG: hypothetical protein KatS3mg112_1784 [Thermogutta sp.]